jgi:iron(III) transport system ATP-binding protein
MSDITIDGLVKRFNGKPPMTAVDELHLEIEAGEFLVLLGPSGCGKTTTLRCLAGLETPDEGTISFGDRVVFDAKRRINISPDKRQLGMVAQSFALWPHMTARKNIRYPLRRKLKRAAADERVEATAAMVDCSNLLDRFPAQLSGGQQQRVAVARGLVARPDLVLFDEPLSNLDTQLRDMVRAQLHELHAQLRFTAVFVTHDQREALALGDRLLIMKSGKIEQLDPPERVYEEPATEYVAAFVGMSNRLVLERADGRWCTDGAEMNGLGLLVDPSVERLAVRFRPDALCLVAPGSTLPESSTSFLAEVVDTEYGGKHLDVVVTVGDGTRCQAQVAIDARGWARSLMPGDRVIAFIEHENVATFDVAGNRIALDRRARAAMARV